MIVQVDDNRRTGDGVGELASRADVAPRKHVFADNPPAIAHAQEFCSINEIDATAPRDVLAKELKIFPNRFHTLVLSGAELPWIGDIHFDLHIEVYRPDRGFADAARAKRAKVIGGLLPRRVVGQMQLSGITCSLKRIKPYVPMYA